MSYVNNIRMFVRVYDLGSMSAAARDQRTSPAVASARSGAVAASPGLACPAGPAWCRSVRVICSTSMPWRPALGAIRLKCANMP